jgi:raffinose/stachyose/melibiose transport system substrate-binding protein
MSAVLAATVVGAVAAAAPGDVPTEPVTLTVEDVSGGSRDPVMEQLNREFMEAHPNVTIKRVRSSFTDLQPKQAIGLSGPNPPDVVEIVVPNDTFGKLGNQGLIVDLDPYIAHYGWDQQFPSSLLDQSRFDATGQILSGPHYGTYMVEDVVGVFYNKEKLAALGLDVPTTWEDFVAALAVAKDAGEIPVMVGNVDKWPMGHVSAMVYNRYATTEDINGWVFNTKPEVKWTDPGFVEANRVLQSWANAGYFTPDFNAVSYDDAVARFGVGFFLPPPMADDPDLRIEGGQGQFWAIAGKSPNPDLAAEYLDFITSDRAGELLVEHGNLPGFVMDQQPTIPPGLYKEVYDALQVVNADYTVSTFENVATPTMRATLGDGYQMLLEGLTTPEDFNAAIQADHDAHYLKP